MVPHGAGIMLWSMWTAPNSPGASAVLGYKVGWTELGPNTASNVRVTPFNAVGDGPATEMVQSPVPVIDSYGFDGIVFDIECGPDCWTSDAMKNVASQLKQHNRRVCPAGYPRLEDPDRLYDLFAVPQRAQHDQRVREHRQERRGEVPGLRGAFIWETSLDKKEGW